MFARTKRIVLAETSASLAGEYEAALVKTRQRIEITGTASATLDLCRHDPPPDLLILDLGPECLNVMQDLKSEGRLPATIVMTGNASVNMAVKAMQIGASDFLIKPFSPERLVSAALTELRREQIETMPADVAGMQPEAQTSTQPPVPATGAGFIGTSPAMQQVYEQIEHAAKSQATVFITGESGTGKELCAEAIHRLSVRAAKAFIPINCAAIPRDLMESELFGHIKGAFTGAIADREGAASLSNGGTLFLDEIAEMTMEMQTKLLRFLQDFTFMKVGGSRLEKTDTRIVCATNRDPLAEVRAGRFREDLFYRLHVVPIFMPPLRLRGTDVIDLCVGLLKRYAAQENKRFEGFTADAEQALLRYPWPGNIRQLQNVIRHVVVMNEGGFITARMLPSALLHMDAVLSGGQVANEAVRSAGRSVIRRLADVEREAIEQAIALYGGNIARAATALGISPSTIYRKKAGWEGGHYVDHAPVQAASRP